MNWSVPHTEKSVRQRTLTRSASMSYTDIPVTDGSVDPLRLSSSLVY
jgi:hypothetical protein